MLIQYPNVTQILNKTKLLPFLSIISIIANKKLARMDGYVLKKLIKKKSSFPLRVSSVNVTEEILMENIIFCSVVDKRKSANKNALINDNS